MDNKILLGKKVLFLAPSFFKYEELIKEKMNLMGAKVYMHDERAVGSPYLKAILKISPCVFNYFTKAYYENIIKKHANEHIDYCFIIKCDMISKSFLLKLRRSFPNAKFCLYLYDSVENIPGITSKIDFFDIASSFDRKDCGNIKSLKFRPLFYSDHFRSKMNDIEDYKYDISFCGTIHSDRYRILSLLEKQFSNLKFFKFYYLQAKFMFYWYKLVKSEFKDVKIDCFSFEKMSNKEMANIQNDTNVIIDIQHPRQMGLTMRTIEMIGLKKKMITTNEDIVNYDFYNDNNIRVISRLCPKISEEFAKNKYVDIPQSIYDKYNLDTWVKDVLDLN